jgi:hypothetical protein
MKPCILVFGMPRSGTTWIGKLFDSHPDTLYRHEPDSVRKLKMPLFPEKEDAARYREELECFIEALPQMRSPEVVGKQPLFPKSYQSSAGLAAYRASVLAAKAVSRVRRHFPSPYRPTAGGLERAWLVWKSIESQGRLGTCMNALPEARAIHLMRHPCGYVASVLRGEATRRFSDATPAAERLWVLKLLLATVPGKNYGVSLDELARLTPEERLAWRWVLTQEKTLADVVGCNRVLTMRYEDVCAEPFEATRRMFAFTGLEFHPQTERFVQASTGATHKAYYSVFKNPRAVANHWRSELPQPVIDRIMAVVRTSALRNHYEDATASGTATAVLA